MTISAMIRELRVKQNISLAELYRRIGQTPPNFNKKMKRGTVSAEEMLKIADVLRITFEQRFIVKRENCIETTNREAKHE